MRREAGDLSLKSQVLSLESEVSGLESQVSGLESSVLSLESQVTVIGGGNVATDAARTARRLGAAKVRLVCLESRREMPAYPWEIRESLEEGIEIFNSWAPQEIITQEGRVKGLKCARCVSVFDLEGKFQPQIQEDESIILDSDYLITAIGQAADRTALKGLADVTLGPGDTIQVDPITLQTDIEWLFAGGDVVNGPASAVEAVSAGHEAAESIRRFLQGRDLKESRGWNPEKIAPLPDRLQGQTVLGKALKSPFPKGGFRGIFEGSCSPSRSKIPPNPPLRKGGTKLSAPEPSRGKESPFP